MDKLDLWEKVRNVPPAAIKSITGGRLKGMSDINPMWRFKSLTEQFGLCGIGWKYEITNKQLEPGGNNEIAAFVDINLFVKIDGEWSAPIPGTGGSSFVANERNGLYTSDECFKMALTDAISVSCKALGFGADVYWEKDTTKYNGKSSGVPSSTEQPKTDQPKIISPAQAKRIYALSGADKNLVLKVIGEFGFKSSQEVTTDKYEEICKKVESLKEAS